MVFQKRALLQTATLGERLRSVREENGWSIADIARTISVQEKYLAALEEGNYRILPGPVYARNFVRKYAEALDVDGATVMELFDREYTIVTSGRVERHLPLERVSTDLPWFRRHGRFILAGVVVAAVLFYFGVQVVRLISPPPLTISQPASDISTKQLHLTVVGQTDPTATVMMNNQPVDIDDQGHFSVPVDLSIGLNTLHITAVKKRSHETVITRQILVEGEQPVITAPTNTNTTNTNGDPSVS